VLATAEALGYRPNLAGRLLSARRSLRLAVCLPHALASFYDDVRAGLADAALPPGGSAVSLVWHDFPRLGTGEANAVRAALDDGADGMIVAPGDPDAVGSVIEEASARRVPVVCVTTDAPRTSRLAAITVDPKTSGALVGELLGRFLRGAGRVAVVSGSRATLDHALKLEGLDEACRALWPGLRLVENVEAHDDVREARAKTRALLAAHADLDGIYVATANSVPVLREIVRAGRQLTVITTDLFPALVPFIASGLVAATIHQRPRTQGQLAFDVLRRYLVDGIRPAPLVQLSPHVVMRSNLHLFGAARDP
jgi:LacI family transcriptional regulator